MGGTEEIKAGLVHSGVREGVQFSNS